MVAPAEALARQGVDVSVVSPSQRKLLVDMTPGGEVLRVGVPADADVLIFQRTTHKNLLPVLRYLRDHTDVATVLDIDDDLSAIAPGNPAFQALQPRPGNDHSWNYLKQAAQIVNMVVVSSPALLARYAPHGRGRVVKNHLPASYFGSARVDSATVGWPASLHSHPDDPSVARTAISQLVREGMEFRIVGNPEGTGRAFGLEEDPAGTGPIDLEDWPRAVAELGIGIAPLADTRFNAGKSHLKILEMSALGVPWVASPRQEYAALHRLGAGLLAERPKDWLKHLRRLTANSAARQELSEAGRAVAEQYRLEDNAWRWLEAWSDALALHRGSAMASSAR